MNTEWIVKATQTSGRTKLLGKKEQLMVCWLIFEEACRDHVGDSFEQKSGAVALVSYGTNCV